MSLAFYTGIVLGFTGTAVFVIWCIWYLGKLKNHLIDGLASLSTIAAQHNGRLVTTEQAVLQCKADHETLGKKYQGVCESQDDVWAEFKGLKKRTEKLGNLAGQVPALQKQLHKVGEELHATDINLLDGDAATFDRLDRVDSELKALAKELGYEIITTTGETVSTISRVAKKGRKSKAPAK